MSSGDNTNQDTPSLDDIEAKDHQTMASPITSSSTRITSLLTRAFGLLQFNSVEYQAQLNIQKAIDLLTGNDKSLEILVSHISVHKNHKTNLTFFF